MRCVAFRPSQRGWLAGFADLELAGKLRLLDCTLHESHGKRWAAPPSRPVLNEDRRTVKMERDRPVIEFVSREVRRQWSDAVLAAVDHFRRREAERQLYGSPDSKTPPTTKSREAR